MWHLLSSVHSLNESDWVSVIWHVGCCAKLKLFLTNVIYVSVHNARQMKQLHEETHLKVLRLVEATPQINQRQLAAALGVSLGKTNFCLKALLEKGLLKMQNFQNSKQKLAYAYLLTPDGMVAKAELTRRFLKRKIEEYEQIEAEIELLKQEVAVKR